MAGIVMRPFLVMYGKTDEAIAFYQDVIPNTQLLDREYYRDDNFEPTPAVRSARMSLGGIEIMFGDTRETKDPQFSGSMALFLECPSEMALVKIADALAEGGEMLMDTGRYEFAPLFSLVRDKFGVTWYLNTRPR